MLFPLVAFTHLTNANNTQGNFPFWLCQKPTKSSIKAFLCHFKATTSKEEEEKLLQQPNTTEPHKHYVFEYSLPTFQVQLNTIPYSYIFNVYKFCC